MLVGLVTEVKPAERRCALTPAGAQELAAVGHDVLVQSGAGDGAGFSDAEYVQARARIAAGAFGGAADLLLKVDVRAGDVVSAPVAEALGLAEVSA